ncbi:MAG TPA: hypothetical protein VNE86_03380 [Nitrososphaerales archaeon]|nr:hypothetical protein [Nitrososphaerales archaeon]
MPEKDQVIIPQWVQALLPSLKYSERLVILLQFSPEPMSRITCKSYTRSLLIPEGWWIGSNFSRDLKKLPKGTISTTEKDGKPLFSITSKGTAYVNDLISAEQDRQKSNFTSSSETRS